MSIQELLTEWAAQTGIDADKTAGMIGVVQSALNEAVDEKVREVVATLEEAHEAEMAQLTESFDKALADKDKEIEAKKEELTERVAEYADYVSQELIAENQGRMNQVEQYESMKSLVENVVNVIAKTGLIDGIDERLDEAQAEIDALRQQLNESNAKIQGFERDAIIAEATEGLTDFQAEKVKTLAEANKAFSGDFKTLVESFVSIVAQKQEQGEAPKKVIKENKQVENDNMAAYLNFLK